MTEQPKSDESTGARESIVLVIDDDASMRRALGNLFQSVGLEVELFGSASEMLQTKLPDVAGCLVLDVRLPGLSGLDFQAELARANIHIPIVFVTGHGDIPMTVRAMKGGAIDFLTKPFRDQDMLDAVATAIERDRKRREGDKIVSDLQTLLETLTPPRARGSGFGVVRPHEQTGSRRTRTCRDYREAPSWAYHEENGAKSLADLVRMAENARNSSQ